MTLSRCTLNSILILVATPLTAAATASPPTAPPPEGPAVLIRANANLRAGPGAAYPVVGAARAGQRLFVLGQADGWWQITLGERTGWIFDALVTPNAAAGQALEVTAFPPPRRPTPPPRRSR